MSNNCQYTNDGLEKVCALLAHVVAKLDLMLDKLIDPATNKGYMPVKTHLVTMVVTIGLLGGVAVFNAYVEAKKSENTKRLVEQTLDKLPARGTTKP